MSNPIPSPANNWQGWRTAAKPYVKRRSSAGAVGYLNAFLRYKCGQDTAPGRAYFSADTEQATRNFQAWCVHFLGANIAIDGECGPQTWPFVDWIAGA